MATGLPVVTTPLGIEGIESKEEKEVLVAEGAEGLAKQTIKLLENQALGGNIAKKARSLVKEKYNWQIISRQLDKIYRALPVSYQND